MIKYPEMPELKVIAVNLLICFFTVFLLSGTVAAEEFSSLPDEPGLSGQPADLLQVYKLAQKNDPTFQGARYRFEASPEIVKQALSELFPSVVLDAYQSDRRTEILDTTIAVYGETLAKYPTRGYTLRLNQPLFEYATFMRVSQAKEEVKSAAFAFEAAKQDLISRVAEAYIELLAARDNLEFTLAEEEGLKFHFELARERYKSGLAPVTDFHDAKARYAYVTAKRVEAEFWLDDALEAMAEITGERIDTFTKFKFEPAETGDDSSRFAEISRTETPGNEPPEGVMPLVTPDPDDVNDWIDAALKRNFQVQIREQGVRIAQREVDRQRSGHLPTLEFVARVLRDDEGGSLFGGSSDVETKEALLQMSFPIYEGGMVLSKTREALQLYAAAKQDLEKETRAVKRETMAAFLGVKSAIKNTAALGQSVVSTRIALEAKREGYKSGLFPSLVVSDAERDAFLSKRDFAKAHYEYIRNSLRLKKAVSTLNEADLTGINQWLK